MAYLKLALNAGTLIKDLDTDINFLRNLESRQVPKIAKRAKSALASSIQKQFVHGADSDGSAWTAITSQTLQRRKKSKDPTPLTDRGFLAKSFKSTAIGKYVRVESNNEYANIHEYGTRRIPKRPMLSKGGELMQGHQKEVFDAIEDGFRTDILKRLKIGG